LPGSTEAIRREKQIKEWKRDWKLALIEKDNPDWLRSRRRTGIPANDPNWVPPEEPD
jgi:putative endonuclease